MTWIQSNLSECVLTRWHPGFNDPYLVSWIMVAIYLLVAALAFAVMWRAPFPPAARRRERAFWGVMVGALVLMAFNKQADLQTLLLTSGRCLMQIQGWLEYRHLVQRIAMIMLALAALSGGMVFLWGLRQTLQRTALPLFGLFLMAVFVLTRVADMLDIDGRLEAVLSGSWPGRVLELSGPLVILVAALILLTQGVRSTTEPDYRPL